MYMWKDLEELTEVCYVDTLVCYPKLIVRPHLLTIKIAYNESLATCMSQTYQISHKNSFFVISCYHSVVLRVRYSTNKP